MVRSKRRRGTSVIAAGFIVLAAGASAQVTLPDAVESTPLSKDAFSTGTLNDSNGALSSDLWDDTDAQTLEFLLAKMPSRPSAPSLGEAMRRILLSSGAAPPGANSSLGGKKLVALAQAGFVDQAQTVASLSTAERGDPWVSQAYAVADLLRGDIDAACRRNSNLSSGRDTLFWVRLRVVCYVEAGERDAADLTLGILREQGSLGVEDDAFLNTAITGIAPKTPATVITALHYAIAKKLDAPIMHGLLDEADGGVLRAIVNDQTMEPATRIESGERALAMGVLNPTILAGILDGIEFDVSQIGAAAQTAAEKPADPLTDALLYQSVQVLSAPEFLRDKAQRISLALSLATEFHRAYALSLVYASEIEALEGALLSPDEAARFAWARMAVGDSAGAGHWLTAMIGANSSVAALPEQQAFQFIELVNLLAVLDPQSAARIASAANVSLLNGAGSRTTANAHSDPSVAAQILEAAFDAATGGKAGQAGLVALAASSGTAPGTEVESVIIGQSLRIAGMSDLERRYEFERAWAEKLANEATDPATVLADDGSLSEDSLTPRVKPRASQ